MGSLPKFLSPVPCNHSIGFVYETQDTCVGIPRFICTFSVTIYAAHCEIRLNLFPLLI